MNKKPVSPLRMCRSFVSIEKNIDVFIELEPDTPIIPDSSQGDLFVCAHVFFLPVKKPDRSMG